jgi:hypothetical protein
VKGVRLMPRSEWLLKLLHMCASKSLKQDRRILQDTGVVNNIAAYPPGIHICYKCINNTVGASGLSVRVYEYGCAFTRLCTDVA